MAREELKVSIIVKGDRIFLGVRRLIATRR